METGELRQLRKMASLPQPDPSFEEELEYGIRLKLTDDAVEYAVMVTRHPEEERFLLVVSMLNRRYWIIDLKALEIQEDNHELEILFELPKNRYFIFLESGRWIFCFSSEREREARLAQFINLQKLERMRKAPDNLDSRYLKLFLRFNENEDDYIDSRELGEVLNSFDIAYDEVVRKCVRDISHEDSRGLRKQEFQTLAKILFCKPELSKLFLKYCASLQGQSSLEFSVANCSSPLMDRKEFELFLKQQQNPSDESIKQAVQSVELHDDKLSFSTFCKFIFSEANSLIDDKKCTLYQNMDLPLTEYYVHSSHNTYLVGNQLTSDSKAFRYVEDFYDGVRCVELDIHDGSDGPIIKHGFTMTAPVAFRAVIQAIAEYSRENEGHLPLILSFENHCSTENQIKMSLILKELLNDKIYLVPQTCSNNHRFPSPNALRGKIIIQGTGLIDNIRPGILRVKLENAGVEVPRAALNSDADTTSASCPAQFIRSKNKFKNWALEREREKKDKTSMLDHAIAEQRHSMQVPSSIQLMQFYSIFVSKLEIQQACWEMGNVSEANILSHIKDTGRMTSLIEFTRKCHLRVYPQGTRFGSSNYNPIPMYEAGAQLVSLNTQSGDIYNMVMTGNFMENGGKKGGYLLKPAHLRSDDLRPSCAFKLAIKVISLHNISNNFDEYCLAKVMMCLVCSRHDEEVNLLNCSLMEVTEEKQKVHYQTIFQQAREFRCKIRDFDFAHVYFQVPGCGHISVPVRLMRTGYRVVPLLDRLKEPKPNSYIFVHVRLEAVTQ